MKGRGGYIEGSKAGAGNHARAAPQSPPGKEVRPPVSGVLVRPGKEVGPEPEPSQERKLGGGHVQGNDSTTACVRRSCAHTFLRHWGIVAPNYAATSARPERRRHHCD